MVDDEVSLDRLTADISVFQRTRGHRFSSDDVATAFVAMQCCPSPERIVDLGCGLGSVLLHLAWCVPDAALVGVEAQAVSFALLQRNIAHNGLGDRVRAHLGDLREPAVVASLGGPFDLVTGTPPYFPPTTATDAMDEQRAFARIEHRGGVEDYVDAAARLLAPDGWFVMCGDADAGERVERAAAAAGLAVREHVVFVPRAGRPPLFSVWAMRLSRADPTAGRAGRVMTLRDERGERTADARALRAFSGFPETAAGAGD